MEELKYPVGKFAVPSEYNDVFRTEAIKTFVELPKMLREVCANLNDEQLNGKYRPEGWSIKQVVHHLADSHLNCLIRLKLALTEDNPTIKPYIEKLWAELPDANNNNIESSLLILEGLHQRIVMLFQNVKEVEWARTIFHPESNRVMTVKFLLALYSWHCKHHLAHVKNAIANPY